MRSRVIAAALAALVPLSLASCSSDDPEPDATPSSSAPAGTSSAASTESGSSEPSPAPSTSIAPATGQQIELRDTLGHRLPAGFEWFVDDSGGSNAVASVPIGTQIFDVTTGQVQSDSTVEESAEAWLATLKDSGKYTYRRADTREVAGLEGWVIEGERTAEHGCASSACESRVFYAFGTVHKGYDAYLQFEYPPDHPHGKAWVEAILASVSWK